MSTVQQISGFLESIGIPVRTAVIDEPTFLPGIRIDRGGLLIDPEKLSYPGDLLHEAGHLAILTPEDRAAMTDNAGDDGGNEMTAIAWSYAASLEIGLDIQILFHPDGYKGGAQSIAENFAAGRYFGHPLLQAWGMAGPDYPKMLRWVR